jgi:hypothetical protein
LEPDVAFFVLAVVPDGGRVPRGHLSIFLLLISASFLALTRESLENQRRVPDFTSTSFLSVQNTTCFPVVAAALDIAFGPV